MNMDLWYSRNSAGHKISVSKKSAGNHLMKVFDLWKRISSWAQCFLTIQSPNDQNYFIVVSVVCFASKPSQSLSLSVHLLEFINVSEKSMGHTFIKSVLNHRENLKIWIASLKSFTPKNIPHLQTKWNQN